MCGGGAAASEHRPAGCFYRTKKSQNGGLLGPYRRPRALSLNGDTVDNMPAGKEQKGETRSMGRSAKRTKAAAASVTEVKQGGQGRVKDSSRDKRLARNRSGPTGQGRVKDKGNDRRLAENRPGPTGQGRVKNPKQDKRLSANREGPTGQGRVKDPKHDRRLSENRAGPTGQGRVKDPSRDKRLRDNRTP
jgi:hypothetical protein